MAFEHALVTNTITGEAVPVLFNPEEYTVRRDVNYAQAAVPGLSAPLLQFVNGNASTLELELLVDTHEAHTVSGAAVNQAGDDVRTLSRRITDLAEIDATTHAPPVVLFTWGSLAFLGVLSRVSQSFVMFRADGTPVRVRLQCTFTEYRNADLEAREIKRETADYSTSVVVGEGETLASVAAGQYGDPRVWRPIALRNGIDDPAELVMGTRLLVPPLPFRDPETGNFYTGNVTAGAGERGARS